MPSKNDECLTRIHFCHSHLPVNVPESCCLISRNSTVPILRTIHLVSWRRERGSIFHLPRIPSCTTGKTTSTSDAHWGITVRRSTLCTSRTLDPTRWLVHLYVSLECTLATLTHARLWPSTYRKRMSFLSMLRLSVVSRPSQNLLLASSLHLAPDLLLVGSSLRPAPDLLLVLLSVPFPRQPRLRDRARSYLRDDI